LLNLKSQKPTSPCNVISNFYRVAHSSGHSVAPPVNFNFEDRDVGIDPERMETHKAEKRAFHRAGPMVANDLVWAKVVQVHETKSK